MQQPEDSASEKDNYLSNLFYHNRYRLGMYLLPADIERLPQDSPKHHGQQREAKQNIFSELFSDLLRYW